MNWIFLAVSGHLLNAIAFIVDKSLLSTTFKRSATYAALMGMISILVVFVSPFVSAWPALSLYPVIIGFGGFFVFALWAFFEALSRSEPSRVVPVVGSLIPLFTLIGSILFFHEVLTRFELFGFALLLIATLILTQEGERKSRLTRQTIFIAFLASVLFAAASLCGKYAFEHANFLGVLVVSRVFTALFGLGIGLFSGAETRMELWTLRRSKKKTALPWYASVLAVGGQLLGGVGFILVYLSLIQGSVAIVNALQAVQYAALVLVAWFGGDRIRTLLQETRAPKMVLAKGIAIVMVAAGLALVAHS